MKRFLAIYKCAENSRNHQAWMELDPQGQEVKMQKGKLALEQWTAKYKNQVSFEGGSLGKTSMIVDRDGIRAIPSHSGGFVVVNAQSIEDAAKIFTEHPHFHIFPGDGVEVFEWLDAARSEQYR